MTAALEGGEWSAARPVHTLPPGKTRYPFCRRLGGPQGRSGRAENLVPTGIRSRTVQPVVIRYTDWATRPTLCKIFKVKCLICWQYVTQIFSDVTSNWLQTATQNIVNEDTFYTGWGKLPKAYVQEWCCTVLQVCESLTLNTSGGMYDFCRMHLLVISKTL